MTHSLSVPLDNPRWEALAQACARGLSAKAAATGLFKRPDRGAKVLRRPQVAARVAAIVESRKRGGSSDVGGVIDKLIDLADAAVKRPEDARGLDVARSCLAEAGRLKQVMPPEPVPARPPRPSMSLAEWRQRYDPTLPGSEAAIRAAAQGAP